MTDDRLARLAVLRDLTLLTQLDDALRQGCRLDLLDGLAGQERHLRALIADPGPLVQAGEVVTGEAGEQVPDPAVRHRAQRVLGRVLGERERLLGER